MLSLFLKDWLLRSCLELVLIFKITVAYVADRIDNLIRSFLDSGPSLLVQSTQLDIITKAVLLHDFFVPLCHSSNKSSIKLLPILCLSLNLIRHFNVVFRKEVINLEAESEHLLQVKLFRVRLVHLHYEFDDIHGLIHTFVFNILTIIRVVLMLPLVRPMGVPS